jgi:hypothetical protein
VVAIGSLRGSDGDDKASLDSEGTDELVNSPKRRMPGATGKAEEQQERSFHALLPFLQTQSQTSLTRLYQRPSSCLSIFRLLGAVERQLVMNLLWLESSIPTATMSSWVTKEGKTWGPYPLFHLVRCNYALYQAFR